MNFAFVQVILAALAITPSFESMLEGHNDLAEAIKVCCNYWSIQRFNPCSYVLSEVLLTLHTNRASPGTPMPGGGSNLANLDPDSKVSTARERSWMKSSWLLSRKLIFGASMLPRWTKSTVIKPLISLLPQLLSQDLILTKRAPDVRIGRVFVMSDLIATCTTAMIALKSIQSVSATVIPR